jgi:hypothetical protein
MVASRSKLSFPSPIGDDSLVVMRAHPRKQMLDRASERLSEDDPVESSTPNVTTRRHAAPVS